MEGELYSTIQKQELQGTPTATSSPRFPDISFVLPAEGTSQRSETSSRRREKYATAGMVLGIIAVISWFIIALGVVTAFLGSIFSYLGMKSSRAKHARRGLTLSLAGGGLSILHIVAVYAGLINYNFFTNDLWVLISISLKQ